jgi:HK97 family phage major capsid protein
MSKYLTPALQELRAALTEADEISKRADGGKLAEARLSFLLAKIKALNSAPASAQDECERFFSDLFKNREMRQMQAGQQSITYTAEAEGGALVPHEFHEEVIHGMAQYDPLLNPDIVTLIESDSFSLKPFTIPGWDMSTYAAVQVAEGVQQNGQAVPTVSGTILNGWKFKASLPVSIELEEDSYTPTMKLMQDAYSVGFARGVGAAFVTGSGSGAPQGVLTGAANSGVVTASGTSLVLNDFENVYFKVNRWHRASPKCAWLMNDAAYQMARQAVDTVGNPLIKLHKDKEMIMSKPVYVSPSLPAYNPSLGTQANGSFCVFGDLAHYFARVSKMVVKRQWQLPGYVENGMALYTGIMRADGRVYDPTSGSSAPIVYANLHS